MGADLIISYFCINESTSMPEIEAINSAHKKKIGSIIINFDTLTEREQVKLFLNLFDFAHKELPDDKNLNIFIVEKKKNESVANLRRTLQSF